MDYFLQYAVALDLSIDPKLTETFKKKNCLASIINKDPNLNSNILSKKYRISHISMNF